MEVFANGLVKEVNVVMAALIKQADEDADNLMQLISKTRVGEWTVTDVAEYSKSFFSSPGADPKSFFSSSVADPTTRTLSMNLDITSVCENARALVKKEYPLIVEDRTFFANYRSALTKRLGAKNPPQKIASWVFQAQVQAGNPDRNTKDRVVLIISYSYKV